MKKEEETNFLPYAGSRSLPLFWLSFAAHKPRHIPHSNTTRECHWPSTIQANSLYYVPHPPRSVQQSVSMIWTYA
jgi:hypothetical protein